VVITAEGGRMESYAEVMRVAKAEISLERDVGVPSIKIGHTRTGGLLMEIPGVDGAEKADKLADLLRQKVGSMGVRIARPVKHADLRVSGLDDTATPNDVVAMLAERGGCKEGDVRVGEIRRSPSTRGVVWASCPVAAAIKAARAGPARVGWAKVTVELLSARPPPPMLQMP